MHCHCGTYNRAPRWTFTDPCKPEVRPGAREESASPAWLAAPAMNARDTTKVYIWRLDTGCGPTLYILEINENATLVFSISFKNGLVHQHYVFFRKLYFKYSIKLSVFVLIDCQYALFKSTFYKTSFLTPCNVLHE